MKYFTSIINPRQYVNGLVKPCMAPSWAAMYQFQQHAFEGFLARIVEPSLVW